MEIKLLRSTLDELLNEYGFIKKGKHYFIEFEKVLIVAKLYYFKWEYRFGFNFRIKELNPDDFDPELIFDSYHALFIDTYKVKTNKVGFELASLNKKKLEKDISERLQRYIEPFRMKPYEYIVSVYLNKVSNVKPFALRKESYEFLKYLIPEKVLERIEKQNKQRMELYLKRKNNS